MSRGSACAAPSDSDADEEGKAEVAPSSDDGDVDLEDKLVPVPPGVVHAEPVPPGAVHAEPDVTDVVARPAELLPSEGVDDVVPPPPSPTRGRDRRTRPSRTDHWGPADCPFGVAAIFPRGVESGMSATCFLHHNVGDANPRMCKKVVMYGVEGLSRADATARVKRWLIRGLSISPHGDDSRSHHRELDARRVCQGGEPEDELDAILAREWVEFKRRWPAAVPSTAH